MAFMDISDFMNRDNSEAMKNHMNRHCNWCWGHGSGNCTICRSQFNKVYIPVRIREIQKELGLAVTR